MSRIYAWFRLAHFSTGKQRAASITVASWLSVRPQTVFAECTLTQTGYTLSRSCLLACRPEATAAKSQFRFGNGEHAARGIKAREARAGATGAGADAARPERVAHQLSDSHEGAIPFLSESHRSVPNECQPSPVASSLRKLCPWPLVRFGPAARRVTASCRERSQLRQRGDCRPR